jgi:regulatory protein
MPETYEKLLQYALRLIAKKRYAKGEITKKLNSRSYANKEDIKKVLKRLEALNYINDSEYARDYISNRMKLNPRGKRLLITELLRKGVDSKTIDEEIDKSNIDEIEAAKYVLQRKYRKINNCPEKKKKEKIIRYLASRGFEFDTIYKVLGMW